MPTKTEIIEAGARAIMDRSCRVEHETDDWELGQSGFSWCDIHYPYAEPQDDSGEIFHWGLQDTQGLCPVAKRSAIAALAAMLPLIKAQLAAEVRDGSQIIHTPEGVPFRMNEPAALIIEEYEP